jgi:glycosyltransferase involved in cell wall biosynthesis
MPAQAVPSQQAPVVAMSPVVSIVVTSAHHDGYFQQAVDSIGTPAVPIETLVIDEPYLRANSSAPVARARNKGLAECRSDFVVFLCGDDRLAPGALELGAAQLEQHPEAAFVFGRCLQKDEDGTVLSSGSRPRISRDHYRELLRHNYITMTAMVMFRRDALRRAGGFAEIAAPASEYDLYLRISRHHPVHDHGQVVAFCRNPLEPSSASAPLLLRETLEVLRRQRPFLEADVASLVAYTEGWARWQEWYAPQVIEEIRAGVRSREWMSALRNTATLLRYHPRGVWHHARRWTRLPHRYGGRAMPA